MLICIIKNNKTTISWNKKMNMMNIFFLFYNIVHSNEAHKRSLSEHNYRKQLCLNEIFETAQTTFIFFSSSVISVFSI